MYVCDIGANVAYREKILILIVLQCFHRIVRSIEKIMTRVVALEQGANNRNDVSHSGTSI